jgi:hypothetical protein
MGIGVCSDISDIMECEDLLDRILCTYAKKHTYYNLESYSSASSTMFLCIWNVEEGEICQSKKLGRSANSDEPKIPLMLIIIVSVGAVTLIVIIIILIIIIKKVKSRGSNRVKEYEMSSISSTNYSSG